MSQSQVAQPVQASGLRGWVRRYPLLTFFAFAYAWSWLAWLPGLLGVGGMVPLLIGGFGPLLAAVAVTRLNGESVRAWWRPVWRWRVRGRFYAYALGLPLCCMGSSTWCWGCWATASTHR